MKKIELSHTTGYILEELDKKTFKALCNSLLEKQFSRAVLHYTDLYEELRSLNATYYLEEKIFDHLNNIVKKNISKANLPEENLEKLKSTYNRFNLSYQLKKGFSFYFGGEEASVECEIIKRLKTNLTPEFITPYRTLTHTIEKLPLYLQDKASTEQLVSELKNLSVSYFSNLLEINISENTIETKRNEKMEAFKHFQIKSHLSINNYKISHPNESIRAINFLNKLLWLITKLIPFISKERRMLLFRGHTKASLLFKDIDYAIYKIAPAA